MAITVLPPIEEPNPFGELVSTITEDVLPLYTAYEINRTRIERLSDYNLSDLAEVLKTHAPEFVTADGKIRWDIVESYYTSGDPNKTKIAQFLINARRLRNDFASATLLEKLNMLDAVGSVTSPEQLEKILTVGKTLDVVRNIIEKSNAPDDVKLWFAVNADVFYERPEVLSLVLKLFSPKEQEQQAKTPQPEGEQPQDKQQMLNLLELIEETKKDPLLKMIEQNLNKQAQETKPTKQKQKTKATKQKQKTKSTKQKQETKPVNQKQETKPADQKSDEKKPTQKRGDGAQTQKPQYLKKDVGDVIVGIIGGLSSFLRDLFFRPTLKERIESKR